MIHLPDLGFLKQLSGMKMGEAKLEPIPDDREIAALISTLFVFIFRV